ncbi:LysR family transcriptional regulator [Rhizobium sullae]|uniref:DNA-binding transcriptional LysR family regulator n=1 Tax=Rhizobium sullae TaxID=50338 RepID=A0A4R3PRM2_RHISU|nr:LysR family transcriptional regulator [Rhizobium sullae]TCU06102.1 DNA-binding transcriptional LysR family regulator [Rhizobium sullae]UWU19208.1 LysR family transcriptional regulator [Rhizobium sullae]
MHWVTLNGLMTFHSIVELGSINRAAHGLNVSQSSLTRTLQQLEARLGGALVTRTPKGVELTAFGELVFTHATDIKKQVGKTETAIKLHQDTSAQLLRVGVVMVHPLLPFCKSVVRLVEKHPEFRIELRFGSAAEMLAGLQQDNLDIVLYYILKGSEADGLVQDVLAEEEVAVFASSSHPLVNNPSPSIKDIAGSRWVLGPPDVSITRLITSVFEESGTPGPDVAIEVDMIPLRRAITQNSQFLSAFQTHHVDPKLANGKLVRIAFPIKQEHRPIGTIRIGQHTRLTRTFVSILKEIYQAELG